MDSFVLDVVVEGVPAPGTTSDEAIWPKALRDRWKPVELPRPDEGDARRAWRVRDPESDLELTVIWAPAPADEEDEEDEEVDALESGEKESSASSPDEKGDEGQKNDGSEENDESEEEGEGGGGGLLFGHSPRSGARGEDLQRVFELALRMAERLGRKLFDPILGESFEAEDWAYRLTEPFHVRGYLATHWVRGDDERVSWVHTHGMDRFGLPDVEAFDVNEDEGEEVVAFLHEAAFAWLRDDAPVPSATPRRIDGVRVRILDAAVGRRRARGYSTESWHDHDGPFVTVVPVGSWRSALEGWKPPVTPRSPLLVERLCAITSEILPEIRTRFEKDGAKVKVKARFPVVAVDAGPPSGFESMWVHVEEWRDDRIRGRLANEPELRLDLACGAAVDVAPTEVWDVLVVQDGRPYRGVSLRRWLRA